MTVGTVADQAEFTLAVGLGYEPITFTGLTSPRGHALFLDDQPVNQSIHGRDFWQTDYDTVTQRWSRTYNVPIEDAAPHRVRFSGQNLGESTRSDATTAKPPAAPRIKR